MNEDLIRKIYTLPKASIKLVDIEEYEQIEYQQEKLCFKISFYKKNVFTKQYAYSYKDSLISDIKQLLKINSRLKISKWVFVCQSAQ